MARWQEVAAMSFKGWTSSNVFRHSARARRDRAKQREVREEEGRAAWRRGDVGDEEGPLPRLTAAAEFEISRDIQEELLSSCSQITTTCFLLLSHWFYLYRARTLARATPTQTHTHSQVSSTRCLWQLILYMLFPWEHCRWVFSASVTKAVGFWEDDSVGESCGVKLFRIFFFFFTQMNKKTKIFHRVISKFKCCLRSGLKRDWKLTTFNQMYCRDVSPPDQFWPWGTLSGYKRSTNLARGVDYQWTNQWTPVLLKMTRLSKCWKRKIQTKE